MRQELERIAEVMQRPEEWILTDHELVHNGSGIRFWVANGLLSFECKPISLGFIGTIKLWFLAKRLMQAVVAGKLERQSLLSPVSDEPARGQWRTEEVSV